ncbi:MAG TPA: hypothetical protein VFO09_00540, partial [Methyloceanibacter sp.]|nr:hypothetical protein [Methyloceanibacter sp.]
LPSSGDPVLKPLLPLTFLRPIYEGWLFFGDPVGWRDTDLMALIAHAIGAMVLLVVVMRAQQERF